MADSPMGLLVQHATSKPPRLSDLDEGVPDELSELVAKLLAKDPADRPNAGEVAEALTAVASGGTSQVEPSSCASTTPPKTVKATATRTKTLFMSSSLPRRS